MGVDTRIHWSLEADIGAPIGTPDPCRWESLSFPPPWPDRPWIFGVMVASRNGIVAWRRRDAGDDPVLAILGGETHPDRLADRRLMRYLRTIGDTGIGAQTVREQPGLVQTPQQPGDEPAPELYAFRESRGLAHHPRNVVYSLFGRLPLDSPMFHTPGLTVIVLTTSAGIAELNRRGADFGKLATIVGPLAEPAALRDAHRRLAAEYGVRYLACEGGHTVLTALHGARLLDEIFLTVTDVVIDERVHSGVLRVMDFDAAGATRVAAGRTTAGAYHFERWRFPAQP